MNKNELIKKLQEMKPDKVELELCYPGGEIIYQNINVFESDESILIQTDEMKFKTL